MPKIKEKNISKTTNKKENKNNKETFDLIVVGGGPAGTSAAIYSLRYRLKTLLITREVGGVAASAHSICNYPGITEISGMELAEQFLHQVEALKEEPSRIIFDEVKSITKEKDLFLVQTNKSNYLGKKVIFAPGAIRKKLNALGEDKLLGKGVSYCATCDAPFFKNKIVAVIGGGNSALTASLILAEHAKQVYIIYRKSEFFRPEPIWLESVKKNKKIKAILSEEITEILGDTRVTGVKLKNAKKTLALDGVFIEIGSVPNLEIIKPLGIKSQDNYILVNADQETNVKGFYAAGDITNSDYKQIVVAAGHGAVAAMHAFKELRPHGDMNQYYP